jgi:phosphatidylglycerophosphate synthase
VRRVHAGPLVGLLCMLALVGALSHRVGLGGSGWAVGLGCGAGMYAALGRAVERHRLQRLGPADRVTLTRAVLAGGVASITAQSFGGPVPVAPLVALSAVALVLDAADGWVARRTRTASAFGARFDMEVDAFLILVLSVYVARPVGWWVLGIGAARYLFVAAGWFLPWLRGVLPARSWCKVVAAIQGVVLTVAAAGVLEGWVTRVALAASLALLAESFGREVWGLWRLHRDQSDADRSGLRGDQLVGRRQGGVVGEAVDG